MDWFTKIDSIAEKLARPAETDEEFEMLKKVESTGGLMYPADALVLFRLSCQLGDAAKILEIGSYRGASTTALGLGTLNKNCQIYSLDCWKDYHVQDDFKLLQPTIPKTDFEVFEIFQNNTAFLGNSLRILKGTSRQFDGFLPANFFDLVFIDGAHDYDSVVADISMSLHALVPNGMLCGHDYHSLGHGVVKAVDELIAYNPAYTVKGLVPGTSVWYAVCP